MKRKIRKKHIKIRKTSI